jgi:3-methylcrotonyl-CoA carboxylase alpha subunit
MFSSLLIANRGEIACRIIRTARALGLRTIAVYSEADRDALHVQVADVALPIGPAPARQSYLDAAKILAAAKAAGAEAIHPGYGFLSEKPDLPELCAASGLAWVGPHAGAIRAMGSKIEAKRLAIAAGVPVIPGYDGADQGDERLAAEALRLGLPVMIKASAGGGGKGMRAAFEEAELKATIATARREAESAFGDGRLLIERLVARPRHVEVQVLGDRHGNLVHLFERDCSVQRNNQKLLEEAPAPNLSAATRAALHAHALSLAAAIGYDSAGTLEFIVEAETEAVFFLEMNTRLQVEHTVTEEITGLDLVEWQLRVAAGEPLPFRQQDLRARGHAIQARVTAERADQGFRPDAGPILLWSGPGELRVDSGVATGSQVGLNYDSLLAKVIAKGSDRDAALARLRAGLDRLTVLGPATTRGFLLDVLATPAFAAGRATTRLIAESWPAGWAADAEDIRLARRLAALAAWLGRAPAAGASPWHSLPGFRVLAGSGRPARGSFMVARDGEAIAVTVVAAGEAFTLSDAEGSVELRAVSADGALEVVLDGKALRCPVSIKGRQVALRARSLEALFEVAPAAEAALAAAAAGGGHAGADVVAPMPGLVAQLAVAVGDRVEAGQTVAVLESMKLFTDLKAGVAGRVAAIGAEPGKTVPAGALLVAIEPQD